MESASKPDAQYYANLFNSGGSIRFSQAESSANLGHGSALQTNNQSSSSWFSSVMPTKQTFTLLTAIGFGLTLIGATTYFVATRLMRKKRDEKTNLEHEEDTEQYQEISDEEDFRMRF